MTHRVFAAAVLGAVAWLASTPDTTYAFGGKLFHKNTGGDCGSCAAPAPAACGASACGHSGYGAPACGTAAVTYVEREVDVQEAKMVSTPTKVRVLKMVEVQKEVTTKVAVMKPSKQEVTSYQWVQVEKPYEYFVNKMVVVNEKRDVMECIRTPKETMVDVVSYQRVARMVTTQVAVCRKVPVAPACGTSAGGCGSSCADSCAPAACAPACEAPARVGLFKRLCHKGSSASCGTSSCASAAPACGPMYTTVTEMVPVTTCVYDNVAVKSQVKQITVTEAWVKKTVDVPVHKCITEKLSGKHLVRECQLVKSVIDVQVCEWVDKKEMAKVWECKEVEETVNVSSCVYVTVKRKVQVAVAAPVAIAAPCDAPCGPAYAPSCAPACAPTCAPACSDHKSRSGGLLKGLFHKKSCGGC